MINVFVCVGSACHIKGSYNIINELQQLIEERKLGEQVTVKAALCLGHCTHAVSVRIDDSEIISLSKEKVGEFLDGLVKDRL